MREKLVIVVRFVEPVENPFKGCEKEYFRSWAKAWEYVRESIEFCLHDEYTDPENIIVFCANHLTDETYNKTEGRWYIDVYTDEAKAFKISEELDFLREETAALFRTVPHTGR